jgi:hypothetical protein
VALHFKVVFDAADPLRLSRFWADALGYEMEDNSALIERVLGYGAANEDDVTTVDGHLAWRAAAAIRHPDDPVDEATGIGQGRRLLFVAVPEPKSVKNRVHLDLHVGPERMHGEAARLCELGATLLREVREPATHHLALADPEGNEFDVQ